jgi:hypothetical protein
MNQHIKSFNELFGFSLRDKQERAYNQLVQEAYREIENFDFRVIFSTGIPDSGTIQSMLQNAAGIAPCFNRLFPDLFLKHWGRGPQMQQLGYTDHPLYSKDYARTPAQDPNTGDLRTVQNPSSQTAGRMNVDFMGQRGFIPTTFAFLIERGSLVSNLDYLRQKLRSELDRHLKYNEQRIQNSITENEAEEIKRRFNRR